MVILSAIWSNLGIKYKRISSDDEVVYICFDKAASQCLDLTEQLKKERSLVEDLKLQLSAKDREIDELQRSHSRKQTECNQLDNFVNKRCCFERFADEMGIAPSESGKYMVHQHLLMNLNRALQKKSSR
jgi:hypothetical protein